MSGRPLPEGLLCLYVALAMVAGTAFDPGVWVAKGVGGAFVAVTIMRLRSEGRDALPSAWWLMAAFGLLSAGSLAWTADPPASQRVLRHFAQEAVLLVALGLSPGRQGLVRSIGWGLVTGGLLLVFGCAHALWTAEPVGGRLVQGELDPNVAAFRLGLAALVWVAAPTVRGIVRTAARSPSLVWGAVGCAALGLAVGLTGSRAALLALGVGAIGLGRPGRSRSMAALAVGVVFGAGVLMSQPQYRGPLAGWSDSDREAVTSGRDAIWLNTLQIVGDHPLLGVGIGAAPSVYTAYRTARMEAGGLTSKPGRDPHNVFLQLLAELGPLGLLCGLAIAGLLARTARRSAPGSASRTPPSAIGLYLLVFALLLGLLEEKIFWLALGLVGLAASTPKDAVG